MVFGEVFNFFKWSLNFQGMSIYIYINPPSGVDPLWSSHGGGTWNPKFQPSPWRGDDLQLLQGRKDPIGELQGHIQEKLGSI